MIDWIDDLKKAYPPIDTTELGISHDIIDEKAKAQLSMRVTQFGMTTEVNCLLLLKISLPVIAVVLSGYSLVFLAFPS